MRFDTAREPAGPGRGAATGTVLRIARFAIHDGPGIRTTVFFKGCPLRCAWCHSPESQRLEPEIMLQPDRCLRCRACTGACPQNAAVPAALADIVAPEGCTTCGACADACLAAAREMVGYTTSVDELLAVLQRDRVFYDESGGGITFSGGEPLMQPVFLLEALRACRAAGLHAAVDTCGHADEETLLDVAREADLFLFDLKIVDEQSHRLLTGVSNRRILSNLEMLAAVHPRVIVRFPLIPGVNADEENVRGVGALLASLGLRRIDVLPYHHAGLAKYRRLHRPYALEQAEPPDPDLQARVSRLLQRYGLTVRAGGEP